MNAKALFATAISILAISSAAQAATTIDLAPFLNKGWYSASTGGPSGQGFTLTVPEGKTYEVSFVSLFKLKHTSGTVTNSFSSDLGTDYDSFWESRNATGPASTPFAAEWDGTFGKKTYTFQDVLDGTSSLKIFDKPPATGDFLFGYRVDSVPEPATWAIMLIGFGGLGAALRMNRRRTAAVAA
jgi:opacity protein-like surface antigen